MEHAISKKMPTLLAGTGRSDITAAAAECPVRDRLFAKALVLDDGSTRLAIISMDAVAIGGICDIGDDFLPRLRARIEEDLDIPARHVLVNASHTHPPGRILCEGEELLRRTLDAVSQAVDNLSEARVGVGTAREDRISMNRNLRMRNGRHWTIRHANPGPPEEDVAGVGPVDPEIGILRVDRKDGTPLAVVYNFACHLLFGDARGSITANFPGIASGILEDCLGHGVTAFFLQGAAGDVIDVGFKNFHQPRDIEPLGERLGLDVLRAARDIPTRPAGLTVISEDVALPRRCDFPDRMAALREEQQALLDSLRFTSLNFRSFLDLYLRQTLHPEYPSADSWTYEQARSVGDSKIEEMDAFNRDLLQKYLANIHAMERLSAIQDELATFARHEDINRNAGDTITAEIQGLRIGDFALVSAPIEVLTEVGLRVKATSPLPHTFLAAFSNGYMHYGPPAEAYDKGGYEVIECFLAPEWQEIFEKKAAAILRRLANPQHNPEAPAHHAPPELTHA